MANLILTNQFGEESDNVVGGALGGIPFGGDLFLFSGATAPTDGVTGLNVAGLGSLYVAQDTGVLYYNSGSKSAPAYTAVITP